MGLLDLFDGGASEAALNQARSNQESINRLPLPVLKEYYPELYKQVVSLNPELETAVNLGPSKMEGITTDPAYKQAQMSALSKLQEIGALGGKDAQFLADKARIEGDINSNLQGQTGAITQNLAARGMSGGMSEMVQRQIAAQQAANRQAQMELDSNAQAQKRALDALMQSGQLGGQLQSQDFNQAAQKASAADQIAQFNAQNQQNVMGRNVSSKNQAQQLNAQNAQNVSNQNVQGSNEAQKYNLGLNQQQYENELKKRGLMSDASKNVQQSYQNQSDSNRQIAGGLISAGSKAFGMG